jgi:hypothetical protein
MPKVKSWGLSDDSEPDDLETYEPYDGEDPKKGVYIFRLTNFRIKANKNDDPMLNGMLVIQDGRPGKKQYNGFPIWFNQNITDQGKPYVKQILKALGLSWSDLVNKTVIEGDMPKSNDDDPAPIVKIGNVKFSGNDVIVRASLGYRKDNTEELEVKSFLEPKDGDDEGGVADEDAADEPDAGDEPEEGNEPEPDADADEPAADEAGEDEWTREALEELSIVSDDPEVYGLAEILDENGTEYDATREDEEYYIALILEEEPPDDPREKKVAKKTAKKGAAKKTAAGKGKAPF